MKKILLIMMLCFSGSAISDSDSFIFRGVCDPSDRNGCDYAFFDEYTGSVIGFYNSKNSTIIPEPHIYVYPWEILHIQHEQKRVQGKIYIKDDYSGLRVLSHRNAEIEQ